MHKNEITFAGKILDNADRALIMLHGRGGSADDILTLESFLDVQEYAILAPQATNNSWYPNSFLAPRHQNEPWLSSALQVISDHVKKLNEQGIASRNICFLGFSQGACLALEFTARNAMRYGGVVAFTGGLIGDRLYSENYHGDFENTPVFIGTSDPDPHIPLERAQSTADFLHQMKADLTFKIYKNMGHTVNQDELDQVNQLIFNK